MYPDTHPLALERHVERHLLREPAVPADRHLAAPAVPVDLAYPLLLPDERPLLDVQHPSTITAVELRST